ncbi:putative protein kinase [Paratrimastix pyriformis]|uniref:Protein kinase domain-containing protein n=1 Tax=Paratrimastix pyriformis TaxID=342808 RepID=A0ABQ8UTA0_9EUKA|nr:putative protein kinase [Paratrimastix pyriformis]
MRFSVYADLIRETDRIPIDADESVVAELAESRGIEPESLIAARILRVLDRIRQYSNLHFRQAQEYWQNFEAGEKPIELSRRINFPPMMVARFLISGYLQGQGKDKQEARKMETAFARDPGLITHPRLREAVDECRRCDRFSSPASTQFRLSLGREHEILLEELLRSLGVPFSTENDLRREGFTKTPDIRLLVPIAVGITEDEAALYGDVPSDTSSELNASMQAILEADPASPGLPLPALPPGPPLRWHVINWIDSKANFGDLSQFEQNVGQFEGYLNRYGAGLTIFWFDFVDELNAIVRSRTQGELIFVRKFPKHVVKLNITESIPPPPPDPAANACLPPYPWAMAALLLVFLASFSVIASVSATPCYVSASGIDQLPCTSPNAPCRNISYAIATASCSHITLLTSIDLEMTILIPPTLPELTIAGSAPGTLVQCGGNVNAIAGGLPNSISALTLVNLTFQGCRGDPSGGALSFTTNATANPVAVLVDHCVFHQCAGMVDLTLVDSWFNGSSVSSVVPCTGSGHGGGAVSLTNPSRVTVTRTVFTHNRAGFDGGALLVTSSSPAETLLTGCHFADNALNAAAPTATVTGGASNSITTTGTQRARALGGALHAPGLRAVAIQNSHFANNTATSTGGGGAGGAVYLGVLQDSLRLVGCNLTGNAMAGTVAATAGALFATGGTDVLVEGCLVSGNTATGQGDTHSGALCLDGAQRVAINHTEFAANQAQSTQACAFGGALRWHATAAGASLRLDHVVAGANRALAGVGFNAQGGAIQVLTEEQSRPVIHLAACDFHQNEARGSAPQGTSGGALTVVSSTPTADRWANVTIEGSQFRGNTLVGINGGGGAVHLGQVDQVLLRETTFTDNGGTAWGGPGDGLVGFAGGALLVGEATNATLDAVQFLSNTLVATNLGKGGALAITTTGAATLRRCLFAHNRLTAWTTAIGGGLGVFGHGELTVEGSRFFNNTIVEGLASSCGGAAGSAGSLTPSRVAWRECWFEGNSASGDSAMGGGLCLSMHRSVELSGLTFLANAANAKSSAAEGGGLAVLIADVLTLSRVNCTGNRVSGPTANGAGAILASGTTSLADSTFVENTAAAGLTAGGGGLSVLFSQDLTMAGSYLGGNRLLCPDGTTQGGALQLQDVVRAHLVDSTLVGSAHLDQTAAYDSGGCLLSHYTAMTQSVVRDLVLRNVTFAGCKAQQGGGMMAGRGASVQLEGCRFEACAASETGGAIATRGVLTDLGSTFTGCTSATGSCIWGNGATVTLTRSQLLANSAAMAGGAVFLEANSIAALENCTATGNRVLLGTGGVLAAESSTATVTGGRYTFNRAKEGGVLYGSRAVLTSRGARYANNSASANGGAWCLYEGTLNGWADDLEANEASMGGALHSSEGFIMLDGTRLVHNAALASGGALHAVSSQLQLHQCSLGANEASLGGAVALEKSAALVAGASNFTQNMAGTGGALFSTGDDSRFELDECQFVGNGATLGGAATFSESGSARGCLFESNFASEGGSAFYLLAGPGHPVSTHTFRFRQSTFRGQVGLTAESLSQPLRAALFLRGVRVEVEETAFTGNLAGAIFAREASEVSLGPGCAFAGNVALVNGLRRPVNVWLSGAGLTLAQPELVNDTAIPGGALWVYPGAGASLPADGLPPLLPLLEGTLMNRPASGCFDTPLLDVTVLLRDPATAAGFARCYFVVSAGPGTDEVQGPVAMSFTNSTAGLQGSCAVPDPRREASYRLVLTNDGHRNVTVASFSTAENRLSLIMGTAGGSVGTVVLLLLGLGCNFLVRWIRLKRAAARELAAWKGYQLATVDFGGLKFVRKIGEGGAGQVFLADLNGTPVAVKFIVSLIGATFEAPQQIVTEYMARGSLDGLLAGRSARLPLQLRLRMAYDMARGINYLHTLQPPIIHRDIKTANMLVTDDLRVKVSDFGISSLSQVGGVATLGGTPEFAAPEVLRDGRYLLASDVFSFGVVLWELTTRQVAWKGVPRDQVITRVMQGDRLPAPPPSEFPAVFCELIGRCCAQDPVARPTMQQIVERLGAEAEMNPYLADPSSQPNKPRRPRRRAAPAGDETADVVLEPLRDERLQAPLLDQPLRNRLKAADESNVTPTVKLFPRPNRPEAKCEMPGWNILLLLDDSAVAAVFQSCRDLAQMHSESFYFARKSFLEQEEHRILTLISEVEESHPAELNAVRESKRRLRSLSYPDLSDVDGTLADLPSSSVVALVFRALNVLLCGSDPEERWALRAHQQIAEFMGIKTTSPLDPLLRFPCGVLSDHQTALLERLVVMPSWEDTEAFVYPRLVSELFQFTSALLDFQQALEPARCTALRSLHRMLTHLAARLVLAPPSIARQRLLFISPASTPPPAAAPEVPAAHPAPGGVSASAAPAPVTPNRKGPAPHALTPYPAPPRVRATSPPGRSSGSQSSPPRPSRTASLARAASPSGSGRLAAAAPVSATATTTPGRPRTAPTAGPRASSPTALRGAVAGPRSRSPAVTTPRARSPAVTTPRSRSPAVANPRARSPATPRTPRAGLIPGAAVTTPRSTTPRSTTPRRPASPRRPMPVQAPVTPMYAARPSPPPSPPPTACPGMATGSPAASPVPSPAPLLPISALCGSPDETRPVLSSPPPTQPLPEAASTSPGRQYQYPAPEVTFTPRRHRAAAAAATTTTTTSTEDSLPPAMAACLSPPPPPSPQTSPPQAAAATPPLAPPARPAGLLALLPEDSPVAPPLAPPSSSAAGAPAQPGWAEVVRARDRLAGVEQRLMQLSRAQVDEIRAMQRPPAIVKRVLAAVALLLGKDTSWPTAQLLLAKFSFQVNVTELSPAVLEAVQPYMLPEGSFEEHFSKTVNNTLVGCLYEWVHRVVQLHRAHRAYLALTAPPARAQGQAQAQWDAMRAHYQQTADQRVGLVCPEPDPLASPPRPAAHPAATATASPAPPTTPRGTAVVVTVAPGASLTPRGVRDRLQGACGLPGDGVPEVDQLGPDHVGQLLAFIHPPPLVPLLFQALFLLLPPTAIRGSRRDPAPHPPAALAPRGLLLGTAGLLPRSQHPVPGRPRVPRLAAADAAAPVPWPPPLGPTRPAGSVTTTVRAEIAAASGTWMWCLRPPNHSILLPLLAVLRFPDDAWMEGQRLLRLPLDELKQILTSHMPQLPTEAQLELLADLVDRPQFSVAQAAQVCPLLGTMAQWVLTALERLLQRLALEPSATATAPSPSSPPGT